MNHAAIDLGGKESQICIRRPDGTIVEQGKVPTRKLTELVTTWTPSRVVMEACAEAFRIADAAIAARYQVRVVPATLVTLIVFVTTERALEKAGSGAGGRNPAGEAGNVPGPVGKSPRKARRLLLAGPSAGVSPAFSR